MIPIRRWTVAIVLGIALTLDTTSLQAAQSLRVLLATDVVKLDVQSSSPVWVSDSTRRGRAVRPVIRIVPSGKGLVVNGVRMMREQLTLQGEQGLTLTFVTSDGAAGTTERGVIKTATIQRVTVPVSGLVHVIRRGGGALVINQVDLEEYVKGVVPAEVNSSWHPEMLKAQAVAARTYALYQQMLSASRDYDVVASVQDQVYRGKQGIDGAVVKAVEETRGLVLTYQGAPIYAAFSSTAAGLTEDAVNVWSKDYPYLKGVECPFDLASPYYQWTASFRRELLEQNLRQQGFPIGTITALTPSSFSRGGRVATLRVVHTEGELILRGEELRKAVGYMVVPSTQFTVESVESEIVLSGYGAGHAVGMCQWGAKELAELGYPFSTILSYYYPDTQLQDMALTKAPILPSS
ncbi:MAG: SpoIID/LytB domain-containing protein [Nitrospira sp.]|nr:SpoIID/LytB domain-containing protein [Nitrospira sp.]